MGLSPLAVCEPLHTVVQLHAESEYELMALTTSESTTATSTSQTWFGCHAKGSDWADAVDREAGVIGGTSAAGVYYRYATGGSEYLVETQYLWDATSETAWESGSSSGASHMGFAEVGRGDRRYLSEESGVFDGPNAAGSYASWSRTNDTIDYVGTHWNYSHTETHLADGTSLVWTCENEFGYTGVGAFRAGDGDSGSFDADGQTGLWYSGFAATLTTSYGQATTFYTSTAVPTRTFAYPLGSGTCTYTMPGWSSWNEHRWTVESESRFDAGWITWVRYSPAESVEGYFGAEGEARTDRWTWLSTSSYTGPAGHLFEQRFGSTTTVTHTSTSVGTPPGDVAVIAAMNAIANQRIGASASGGHGTANSTDGQGDGGIAADAVVAAKDLNLAEFFAQADAQPGSQPAWQAAGQAAGQLAGDSSEPGSEPAKAPPARHPDSAMSESWLDALDELEDHAKTAHDEPEQLPALTDAAIASFTALDNAGSGTTGGVIYAALSDAPEGGTPPPSAGGAWATVWGWSGPHRPKVTVVNQEEADAALSQRHAVPTNPPRCMACHGGFNAGLLKWEELSREEQIAIIRALNTPWPILGGNSLFLEDFLFGQGERNRFYGPDSRETKEMRESPGGVKLRDEFYNTGCKNVTGFIYGTGEAARESPPWGSTTPAQVGGFIGYAHNNGDGTVTFTIYNEAGTHSFFYHAVPNRTSPTGPMRTIYQTFQWTEQIDKGRCR